MGIIARILGISRTKGPSQPSCWRFENGRLEIDLSKAPELGKPGGGLRFEGEGIPERVMVMHDDNGNYRAFNNRCTHAGRRLDPLPGQAAVRCCSVSKSTFDLNGEKVSGPANGSIKTYQVHLENDKLIVDLS